MGQQQIKACLPSIRLCDLSENRTNQFTLIKTLCVITAGAYRLQLWNVTFSHVHCSNICLLSHVSQEKEDRSKESPQRGLEPT